jgi:hypothetical protein
VQSSHLRRVALATLAVMTFAGQPMAASAGTLDLGGIFAGAEASDPPGTTITVKPGTDAAWLTSAAAGGSLTGAISTYSSAPAGGPAGPGAFRHRLNSGSDSATWSSGLFAGVRLDTLTELKYSTFVTLGSNAPSLRLQLDLNGDGFFEGASVDEELVFEPIYQTGTYPGESFANQCSGIPGCVAKGQWQTWDARNGGWYSRKLGQSGPPLKTLASWAAEYPTAQVANGASLIFKSGSGWANTNVFFDALRVNGITYDFEPLNIEITPDSEALFPRITLDGTSNLQVPRTENHALQQYSTAVEPLSGRGSLHQKVKVHADRVYVHAEPAGGLALSELTGLTYATYLRNHGTKQAAPFMSVYLDLDGDTLYSGTSADDVLQFIPGEQSGTAMCPSAGSCVSSDTWQMWDGLSGLWYSRRELVNNGTQTFKRLDEWVGDYPDARIALGNAVAIQVGSGYSNVDAFVDYININGTTYDFETQVVTVSPQQLNGWFFNPVPGTRSGDTRRQDFENGPPNPEFGAGGLRHLAPTSHADEDLTAIFPLLAGQPIESLTELSYRTYQRTNNVSQAPLIKVQVDYDGENYYTTQNEDRLIIFEPVYQTASSRHPAYSSGYPHTLPPGCTGPCLKQGEWQNWDVLGGQVYFGGNAVNQQHPWDELITAISSEELPPGTPENITRGRIAFGERPLSIETDNAFANVDSTIDSITINGVTFDFEATVPEPQLDGERRQDEPYRLIANDTEAPQGNPLDVGIYGACTDDSLFFSFESQTPGHNMNVGKIFLDSNHNDVYDGRGQDRMISYSVNGQIAEGDVGQPDSVPIPGAQVKVRSDNKAVEIRLPRSLFGEAWFGYDIWSDSSGRNTSWDTFNYADQRGFIPSPCLPIPEEVFGATPIDCNLYDTDIRLIQYVIDRSASTHLKLFGTCDVSQAAAHGGTTTSINSAAIIVDRDGLTIESLDITRRGLIRGNGAQAGFYIAPGTKDVTIRGLAFTDLSRPIVAQNTIRTTIGAPTPLEPLSPLGNRMYGIGSMQEGVLALASSGNTQTETTITHGANGLLSRKYDTPLSGDVVGAPGPDGQDLVDIKILGNYISYRPPGPNTLNSDVTGIVVRQRGSARDAYGVDVSQNAVGMAGSEFPNFNMAGIRIHADSNDPNFAHIKDVRVFKNTLGRLEELNLTRVDSNLPDAGDLQATGRTGIALGRLSDFLVQGNSIRTILSKVPAIDMMGGGIVVYDSFDGQIETNSIITIAAPGTAAADLGSIGIVDNLMDLFTATPAGAGKPTRDIKVIANYTGWSGNNPSDFGAQRGLLVSGATGIDAQLNQFKTIGDKSILLGTAISGPGTAFGWQATLGPQRVAQSNFCGNWLNIHRGTPGPGENPRDTPPSQVQWNASGLGSTGNSFPNGQFQTGNHNCV